MKKIKLFLITLLCMVGVMNVCAQVVLDSPHDQLISTNTNVGTRSGQSWVSKASYEVSGYNNIQVADKQSAVSTYGMNNDSDGNLTLKVSNLDSRSLTITAPIGWVIGGYRFDLTCDNRNVSVNCSGSSYSTGDHVERVINDMDNVSLEVSRSGFGILSGTATFKNFYVTLKRKAENTILDADGHNVISGNRYAFSYTLKSGRNYPDYYFSAADDDIHVSSMDNGPYVNGNVFISDEYIWTPEFVNGNVWFTLRNSKSGKYLAGETENDDPKLTALNQTDAIKFCPYGPYKNDDDTPYYYSWATPRTPLEWKDYRFLNADGNTTGFCLFNDGGVERSRFRLHRIEFVRFNGVYVQNENGVYEPVNYRVNGGNSRIGVSELYHEHAEDKNHNVTKTIEGKIQSIEPIVTVGSDFTVKYVVNGVEQTNFAPTSLKDADVVEVYYARKTPISKFVKIKNNNGQYIKAGDAGSDLTVAANSNDALFYLDGTTLLSYTKGVYVKDTKVGDIEESGSTMLLIKNSADAKVAVKSGADYLADDGSSVSAIKVKPDGAYTVEYISELPVKLNPVGDHRYGTFYAPVDVTVPEGLEAYRVDGITPGENADVLGLVLVTEIPANTGVILYEETSTETEYTLAITSDVDDASSLLNGVCPRRYVKDSETLYGLNKKSINGKDTAGFYKMKTGSALSPFRAFLDYTESEQGESKGFVFSFTELDAIEAIEMSHAEDAIYDLQGRKVQNPGTGIYIVNGKKIMIKK